VILNRVIAFIGLGNPGEKFSNTKHNAGFWVVTEWAKRYQLSFEPGKGQYIVAKHRKRGVLLIKPLAGMNLSGTAVKQASNEWNLLPSETFIIVDDVDLPLGKIRLKPKGGDGCHRGLENIIYHLQTDNFPRVRLGIGTEENMRPAEKYVMKPFKLNKKSEVDRMIVLGADVLDSISTKGLDSSMNKFNS